MTVLVLHLLMQLSSLVQPMQQTPTKDAVPPGTAPRAPSLLVSFVGGEAAQDVANVMSALAAAPPTAAPDARYVGLLPVSAAEVAAGDSICLMAKKRNLPVACPSIETLVGRLNPGLKSGQVLRIGQSIVLPAPDVVVRRSKRSYSNVDPNQRGWSSIAKRWSQPAVRASTETTVVEFNSYDLKFSYGEDRQARQAAASVTKLASRNVLIHPPETVQPRPSSAFSDLVSVYQSDCAGVGGRPSLHSYVELLDPDPDVGLQNVLDAQPAPVARPSVYIVDTPIVKTPGFTPGVNAATVQCRWTTFVEALHHGTHMAGIIGGQNGGGLRGLADGARVAPQVWHRANATGTAVLEAEPDRSSNLTKLIEQDSGAAQNWDGSDRDANSVFLFASQMDPYRADDLQADGQLIEAGRRLKYSVPGAINDVRPLFIVAAGQDEPGHPRTRLVNTSAVSPQNLGDWQNVIVVTACVECRRSAIKLLDTANYGAGPNPIVHIAAPGGKPLPGWVDATDMASASGTSQAAAFAAGVAAAMLARYPKAYAAANRIKTRLQMTAWPLLPQSGAGSDPANGLATGVIDYQRAMLDPARTWLKLVGGSWAPVRIKAWPDAVKLIDLQNNASFIDGSSWLRLLAIPAPGQPPTYAIYRAGGVSRLGVVERIGPVTLANPQAVVELCGESPVKLSNIEELIVSTSPRPYANPCQ